MLQWERKQDQKNEEKKADTRDRKRKPQIQIAPKLEKIQKKSNSRGGERGECKQIVGVVTISSQSLGITIDEQHGKAILTKKKVASSEQSGVCPEIKAANIPLGACLSCINGTKIASVAQAAHIIRTSPRPVTLRFEFASAQHHQPENRIPLHKKS